MGSMITKTNIEWVQNPKETWIHIKDPVKRERAKRGYVFNPVWGCRTGCPYCYARNIAKRFGKKIAQKECEFHASYKNVNQLNFWKGYSMQGLSTFEPTWLESNFQRKFPRKLSRIFVNSMSDIRWWEPEWIVKVKNRIKKHPQHTFIFLTKFPEVYSRFIFPKNCWLGVTITKNSEMEKLESFDYLFDPNYQKTNFTFVSFEPLTEGIDLSAVKRHQIGWIIVGAETGNRKGKIIPRFQWILDIAMYCHKNGIPLFEKDNLKSLSASWDGKLTQQFPGGLKDEK